MIDAGVESPLGEVLELVRPVTGDLDVGGLDVESAAAVVEAASWRREGFRSLAAWMASRRGRRQLVSAGRRCFRFRDLSLRPSAQNSTTERRGTARRR